MSWIDAWRIPWHIATDMIAARVIGNRMASSGDGERVETGYINTDDLVYLPGSDKPLHPSFAKLYKTLGRT